MWPPSCRWLESLLEAKFFDTCVMHAGIKKSERNYYCLNCRHSNICQHCLPNHATHELLQVRRYVYHDVVRVQDVEMYLDCKSIQTYIINGEAVYRIDGMANLGLRRTNPPCSWSVRPCCVSLNSPALRHPLPGANVVFLNDRPHTKPVKSVPKACETCSRSLQDHYRFCSLSCKITALASNRAGPVGRVLKRKSVELRSEPEAEGGVDGGASGAHDTHAWAPTPVYSGVEAPCTPCVTSTDELENLTKTVRRQRSDSITSNYYQQADYQHMGGHAKKPRSTNVPSKHNIVQAIRSMCNTLQSCPSRRKNANPSQSPVC
jgi:hypothetical protein